MFESDFQCKFCTYLLFAYWPPDISQSGMPDTGFVWIHQRCIYYPLCRCIQDFLKDIGIHSMLYYTIGLNEKYKSDMNILNNFEESIDCSGFSILFYFPDPKESLE